MAKAKSRQERVRLQYKSGMRDALITTALLREVKDAFDGRKI